MANVSFLGQHFLSAIAVDRENAILPGDGDGSLGLAVGRVDIGDGRRIIAAKETIILGIGEELASLRPSSARIENRCGGLIGKQLARRLQVPSSLSWTGRSRNPARQTQSASVEWSRWTTWRA